MTTKDKELVKNNNGVREALMDILTKFDVHRNKGMHEALLIEKTLSLKESYEQTNFNKYKSKISKLIKYVVGKKKNMLNKFLSLKALDES